MKKLFIFLLVVIIAIIGGLLWWEKGVFPVNQQDISKKTFIIKNNESIREIGYSLKQKGFIRDPIVFFLVIKEQSLDGKIQAGIFHLSPSMNAFEIAQNLTHGTLDTWITIPEGKRAEEIADILWAKLPNYQPSWKNALLANEGYLFPDTYRIPEDADSALVISLMKKNFAKKFDSLQKNPTNPLTDREILIVASLVEREAKFPEDRPLVASVIYNRLKKSMPLQIDATVQYTLGYQPAEKSWWKKNVTSDDLKIDSFYNTYKNQGLPPAPICNPGLPALQAAIKPAVTGYIYYISDKTGHLHFSKTLEEHNGDIAKYGLL